MNISRAFLNRLLLTAGLATAVLTAALVSVAPAGADSPRPGGGRAATPTPTPIPGAGPLTLPAPSKPVTTVPVTPLTLDRVEVTEVGGTRATLVVHASAPTIMSYTLRRAGDAGSGTAGLPNAAYIDEHRVGLPNLQSNTTYEVAVTATSADGRNATATKTFTTPKKRVVVTLESIDIKDDGDGFLSGNGEPVWYVKPYWGGRSFVSPYWDGSFCYPNVPGTSTAPHRCKPGSYGEGRITPRNSTGQAMMIIFAEEHFDPGTFPRKISLQVWAKEDDAIGGAQIIECVTGDCPVGDDASMREWLVPQGVESAEQRITVPAVDASTGFESTLTFRFELVHHNAPYPMQSPNAPINTWHK